MLGPQRRTFFHRLPYESYFLPLLTLTQFRHSYTLHYPLHLIEGSLTLTPILARRSAVLFEQRQNNFKVTPAPNWDHGADRPWENESCKNGKKSMNWELTQIPNTKIAASSAWIVMNPL